MQTMTKRRGDISKPPAKQAKRTQSTKDKSKMKEQF